MNNHVFFNVNNYKLGMVKSIIGRKNDDEKKFEERRYNILKANLKKIDWTPVRDRKGNSIKRRIIPRIFSHDETQGRVLTDGWRIPGNMISINDSVLISMV